MASETITYPTREDIEHERAFWFSDVLTKHQHPKSTVLLIRALYELQQCEFPGCSDYERTAESDAHQPNPDGTFFGHVHHHPFTRKPK